MHYEVTCPYHSTPNRTRCCKELEFESDAEIEHVVAQLKLWAVLGQDFEFGPAGLAGHMQLKPGNLDIFSSMQLEALCPPTDDEALLPEELRDGFVGPAPGALATPVPHEDGNETPTADNGYATPTGDAPGMPQLHTGDATPDGCSSSDSPSSSSSSSSDSDS